MNSKATDYLLLHYPFSLVVSIEVSTTGFSIQLLQHLRGKLLELVTLLGRGGEGRGDIALYELYRYVRPQRVWFLIRFGHK